MDNTSNVQSINQKNGLAKRAALYFGILAFALVLLLLLGAGNASAEDFSGDISVDTTWESGSVYNLTGDVTILDGATLTIEENVTVVAETYCVIWVEGALVVDGSADLPVVFTFNHTAVPAAAGQWYGIFFTEGSSGSVNFADFNSTWTSIYFENVSIPCSNIDINNTRWGMAWEFSGVEQNIAVSLTDIAIKNALNEGFEIWNYNGSLAVTMDGVSMDNVDTLADIYARTVAGTGMVSVTVHNSMFNTEFGFQISTDHPGDLELIDSEFTNIDDYLFWLSDDSGDKSIVIDGVVMDNCFGGIHYYVEFGNFDVSITDSSLNAIDVILDLTVNSNSLTNGFITIEISGSELSGAFMGVRTWSEELNPVMVTDSMFDGLGTALHFDVRTNDVVVDFDNVTAMDAGTCLYVLANNGDLDLTVTDSSIGTWYFGVQAQVSSLTEEDMSTIDVTIENSVFEGGDFGIWVTSINGGTVLINNTQFLGQHANSFAFDSVYGLVDLEITNSVFDGSSANDVTIYTVEQIDYEFLLYGRQNNWAGWDDVYNEGYVELPFAFMMDGEEFTEVWFDSDGYLAFFGMYDHFVEPIGDEELSYWDDHFFGYKVADDESWVLFNWYAANDYSWYGYSNSFQVILYATGEIQINFAAMDGWYYDSDYWGMDTYDATYDMYNLMGMWVWDMDYSSFLFTPHALSYGGAIVVRSDLGDVNAALVDNVITSYIGGGAMLVAFDGSIVLDMTGNEISYMSTMMAPAVFAAGAFNGTMDASILNNTFERLWAPAGYLEAVSPAGGSHTIDVIGNTFNKAFFGISSEIYAGDDMSVDAAEATLTVVANFQDNVMTDCFGLSNTVDVSSDDATSWNITVHQTFTNNVMTQVWYEGSFPFDMMIPWFIIEAGLNVWEAEDDYLTSVTVEHIVTVTGNDVQGTGYQWVAVDVYSDVDNRRGDVDVARDINVSDNIITITGGEVGIYIWGEDGVGCGMLSDVNNVVVERNEIYDGYQWIYGIDVEFGADAFDGAEMAIDATVDVSVSIMDNYVEGSYMGAYLDLWYYQDNTVGDWTVNAIAHIDENQFNGTMYGVEAYIYGGVWFDDNYWPYYDEVAVGNYVMDYVLTVDNNVINSVGGDWYPWDNTIIYVGVGYWAEVDPSTHFTEAYGMINGEVSVSGNEIAQEDGYLNGIYVDHWYGSEKTGVLDITIDLAVEDNILSTDDYDLPEFGIMLNDYAWLYGDWNIPTDAPEIMANVSWSVTGNQVSGPFMSGIVFWQYTDLDSPMGNMVQNMGIDMSDNTVTGAVMGGIGYVIDRYEYNGGYIEMHIDLAIDDNTVVMDGMPMTTPYIESMGTFVSMGDMYMPISDEIHGVSLSMDVTVSGNAISGATIGMYLLDEYYEEDDDSLQVYIWAEEVNVVVENNYINDSAVAIMANEGNISIVNNVLENVEYGVYWNWANGDITDNTITAWEGIYLYYPYAVVVEGNTIDFAYMGIQVYGWTEMSDVQIMDNVLTGVEMEVEDGPIDGMGAIYLDYVGNVLIADNMISGAYYGVFVDGAYNLTISGNQITSILGDDGYGVYLYYVYDGWVESNHISNSGYGVYADDGCRNLVIGNNTIMDNSYTGVYVYYYTWFVTLYNNEITGNGDWGVYAYNWEGLKWIVDANCLVARNDVYFEGDLEVREGGTMMIEDVHEFRIYDEELLVEEGGLFSASNVNFYGWAYVNVRGTFWANVCLFDGFDIYLGPTAEADIRAGAIMFYDYAAIIVDGCAPVIADNLIFSPYAMYGILIENGASPSIVSNIIALNNQGIYARGGDMGGIYDNLLLLNLDSGILADGVTGRIHDNVFLANKIEILLRDSDVSVEDNEIGYTDLFQVLADYAPLLSHFVSIGGDEEASTEDPVAMLDSIMGIYDFDLWNLATWVKGHNGIWAENSVVQTSGNQYGMLNYALYAIDSEIHFADDVTTNVLQVPHVYEGEMVNYSLNIYVLNGIYASGCQLWVDGSTIEVIDDALVLDGTDAWVTGATLEAGDFDYFIFGGSEVYNIDTTYESAKVEDSHSLNEGTWLTIYCEEDGEAAANVTIVITNGKGEIVFEGVTDAHGKVKVLLIQYAYTYEGMDDGYNPYTINATFPSGEVESVELTLNESYMDITIVGEEETDMGAILAVIGVLVIILLIVAAVVVMRRRK